MIQTSHDTRPDDAEILEMIINEQTERTKQLKEYFRLSSHITGMKNGKTTYSTPSSEDNEKRNALVASWAETENTYGIQLASFGFILPVEDPYNPHPLASTAVQALRNNDPEIFKQEPHSLLIAEIILLRVIGERQKRSAAALRH